MESLLKDSEGRTDRLSQFARRRKQFKSSCRTGHRPNRRPSEDSTGLAPPTGNEWNSPQTGGSYCKRRDKPLNKLTERKTPLIFETPCLLRGRPLIVHVEAAAYHWARRDETPTLPSFCPSSPPPPPSLPPTTSHKPPP